MADPAMGVQSRVRVFSVFMVVVVSQVVVVRAAAPWCWATLHREREKTRPWPGLQFLLARVGTREPGEPGKRRRLRGREVERSRGWEAEWPYVKLLLLERAVVDVESDDDAAGRLSARCKHVERTSQLTELADWRAQHGRFPLLVRRLIAAAVGGGATLKSAKRNRQGSSGTAGRRVRGAAVRE